MNYASIKSCDIANGPGVRVSLFVSGCTHHCKDCFNAEAWDFNYGEPFTDEVMDKLLRLLAPDYVRGITYLGGEPFDPRNQEGLLLLSRKIRERLPEKSIWAFTGYVYGGNLPIVPDVTDELLSALDVLVDGPFIAAQKNLSLRFPGLEQPAAHRYEKNARGRGGHSLGRGAVISGETPCRKSKSTIFPMIFRDSRQRKSATGSTFTARRI